MALTKKVDSDALRASERRLEARGEHTGLQATVGSNYFQGTCDACDRPERGGIVVTLKIGSIISVLCPDHFNALRGRLERLAPVRDI